MNSCKNFSKKYPVVVAVLTVLLVFALLQITELFPKVSFYAAIREVFMAVVVFVWTFLLMGKEKVRFSSDGFRYSFKLFRFYFLFLGIFCALTLFGTLATSGLPPKFLVNIINALITGATVGIVEEFTFRGLVFGGILQKTGNSKKSIILAAVVSGLLFGVMHVINSALAGEISDWGTVLSATLKTFQTAIFGVILAFVYLKTRNIYAIAAIHGLDDLMLFIQSSASQGGGVKPSSYVSGDLGIKFFSYGLFILILVPALIKSIKEIDENEAIPFDDDFLPRAVEYKKGIKG